MDETKENGDTFAIKNPYIESEIKTFEMLDAPHLEEIMKLYDQLPDFEKAIEESNIDYIQKYFFIFTDHISEVSFDQKSPYNFIEFIFPYILGLIHVNVNQSVLKEVLRSLAHILSRSEYYTQKFVDSSGLEKIIEIVNCKTPDMITGLCINIIFLICQNSDFQYLIELFPFQELFEMLTSNEYGKYTQEGFFLLLSCYLNLMTDDDIFQFFSYISQILTNKKFSNDVILQMYCIIARYFEDNEEKGIELIPEEIINILLDNICNIIKLTPLDDIDDIFFLIYHISKSKKDLQLPIDNLYKIILDQNTDKKIIEHIVTMIANLIKINDDFEYTKGFVTDSISNVIDLCLDKGSLKTKTSSLFLISAVLFDSNIELFCSYLYSSIFDNFIDFIESIEDESVVFIGVGILGYAFTKLQTIAPDSEEFQIFLSKILSSDLLDRFNILADEYPNHFDLYVDIGSMIESESWRVISE